MNRRYWLALAVLWLGVEVCSAAPKKEYLSQTYIDTVIQRAYENFSTALAEAGTDMSIESAIMRARTTVDRLKKLAEADPNKNYILWKVSELEYQIFLEERDIVSQKSTKDMGRINELADAFNAEVGKQRPDFVKLQDFQEQFAALDGAKGNEIEGLITKRSNQIARLVLTQIQTALDKNDVEGVRTALDYCYANRGILAISDDQLAKFATTQQSRIKIADQRRFIEEDILAAQRTIGISDFYAARTILGLIDRRISDVTSNLTPQQVRMYQAKRDRLVASIATKEDSLVEVNIQVYNSSGRAAAQEFLDKTLRAKHGVSREKRALVDQAMVDAAVAERKDVNPELRRTFVDLADVAMETEGGSDLLGDIGSKAKRRAQERADSADAAQREAEMAAQTAYAKEHRREIRAKEKQRRKEDKQMARMKEKEKAKEKEQTQVAMAQDDRTSQSRPTLAPSQGDRMASEKKKAEEALSVRRSSRSSSQTQTENVDDVNRALAQQNIVLIYNLIEQGLADAAYSRFMTLRDPLRQHLVADAYATLEATVMDAYQSRSADAQ